MIFAIFSHVEHKIKANQYWGYAPYVREMNLWLSKIDKVKITAPSSKRNITAVECPYRHEKISFEEIPAFNFLSAKNILHSLFKMPVICFRIWRGMSKADHLHLRCPGNIGLLACICQIFFPGKPKSVKYAGNWDPNANQPWTYNFQKLILRNTFFTRNMQVLVYGNWPGQSKNIKPFFTASFSEREIPEIKEKSFQGPLTFLFVGNLVEGKRPLEAVKLIQELKKKLARSLETPEVQMEIYGDGPERMKLEKYVNEHELKEVVIFKGSRSLDELKEGYQKAHFVILPSRSEGWPKALAEGMFFGCIPIATQVSCVPWMLNYGKRGILLSDHANGQKLNRSGERTEDRRQDVVKISKLLADQEEMKRMSEDAKKWSQQYTLEKFEKAIREVLLHSNKETVANEKLSPGSPAGRQAGFRDGVKREKSKE